MRGAGISGAGIESDLDNATDTPPDESDPTVQAGATDTTGAGGDGGVPQADPPAEA